MKFFRKLQGNDFISIVFIVKFWENDHFCTEKPQKPKKLFSRDRSAKTEYRFEICSKFPCCRPAISLRILFYKSRSNYFLVFSSFLETGRPSDPFFFFFIFIILFMFAIPNMALLPISITSFLCVYVCAPSQFSQYFIVLWLRNQVVVMVWVRVL